MTDVEFRDHVVQSLTELKTDMKSLIGNGQPGRIDKIEASIDDLKAYKNKLYGIAMGISGAVSCAAAVIYHFLRR